MKKVYIVMDEPEKCEKCKLSSEAGFGAVICSIIGKLIGLDEEIRNVEKPEWCPLKPLPEKQALDIATCNALSFSEKEMDMASGWNACIDRILEGGD